VVVVFGAGGGLGGALAETIRATQKFEHVVAFSRSTSPSIDLLDEASLERAMAFAADRGGVIRRTWPAAWKCVERKPCPEQWDCLSDGGCSPLPTT
jgi:NAD(P)-dependent dehydrogenase (short-subunit alcohol dehydrogenase family)